MQCSVIEWARHHGIRGCQCAEFAPNGKHPVINLLPEQQDVVDLGGTMRLGLYPAIAPIVWLLSSIKRR